MKVLFQSKIDTAGQLWNYTQALESAGHHARSLTYRKHPFGYRNDIYMNIDVNDYWDKWVSRLKRGKWIVRAGAQFDILHFKSGNSLTTSHIDLQLFNHIKKPMVMMYTGSDARIESIARQGNPYYNSSLARDEDQVRRDLDRASDFVDTAIIQYFELEQYVAEYFENVHRIPRAVDTERLTPVFKSDSPFTIVHSPSNKDFKGTEQISKAVEQLESQYDIEYQLLSGVDHDEVIRTIQNADLVIDQMYVGTFGLISLEAMSLGTPTICHVRDEYYNRYPDELPIIRATVDDLQEKIEGMIVNNENRDRVAREGRSYVESYHSLPVVGEQLASLYKSIL